MSSNANVCSQFTNTGGHGITCPGPLGLSGRNGGGESAPQHMPASVTALGQSSPWGLWFDWPSGLWGMDGAAAWEGLILTMDMRPVEPCPQPTHPHRGALTARLSVRVQLSVV
jgi:hypothetical protein